MKASELKYRIDEIARSDAAGAAEPAHCTQLLRLESQNCQEARSMIKYEIGAKGMEYGLLKARTKADKIPWEIRGPIVEREAQKYTDDVAKLDEEYAAFGEVEALADEYIRYICHRSHPYLKEGGGERKRGLVVLAPY